MGHTTFAWTLKTNDLTEPQKELVVLSNWEE